MKLYDKNGDIEIKDILESLEMKSTSNYKEMPINAFNFNEDNCTMYNHIISALKISHFRKIKRTPSGGISATTRACYDVRYKGGCIELTICNYMGKSCRLQMRNSSTDLFANNKLLMSGHEAFYEFKTICRQFKIDLNKYAHLDYEKALEEKKQIEKAMIRVIAPEFIGDVWKNAHHIDFHSSYMSGLVNTHPEFADVVNYIYNHRKSDDIKYKMILNMTQGYMQSEHCKYKFAHLSRDMIKDNNDRIRALVRKLIRAGRIPLLLNTDGIWYQGDIYHDSDEGDTICTWGHDHTNCTLRIKSDGAYEYIEDGQYHPVVRGHTNLDKYKPRTEWEWGDIFKEDCELIEYTYKDEYVWWDGSNKGAIEYEQ